jgi:hypothetical protein
MDKKHTLVGEDFFRMMMHREDERRRCFVGGVTYGVAAATAVLRTSCRSSATGENNSACRDQPTSQPSRRHRKCRRISGGGEET